MLLRAFTGSHAAANSRARTRCPVSSRRISCTSFKGASRSHGRSLRTPATLRLERPTVALVQPRVDFRDERDRLGRAAAEIETDGRTEPFAESLRVLTQIAEQPLSTVRRSEQPDIGDL